MSSLHWSRPEIFLFFSSKAGLLSLPRFFFIIIELINYMMHLLIIFLSRATLVSKSSRDFTSSIQGIPSFLQWCLLLASDCLAERFKMSGDFGKGDSWKTEERGFNLINFGGFLFEQILLSIWRLLRRALVGGLFFERSGNILRKYVLWKCCLIFRARFLV